MKHTELQKCAFLFVVNENRKDKKFLNAQYLKPILTQMKGFQGVL